MGNPVAVAQTLVALLHLAYFFLTRFLCGSFTLRQALRLGSDEFVIGTVSPNRLVLHLSMCEAAIGGLSYVSLSIFFITFFLGRGARAAVPRLGPELGPGGQHFARAGHGPLTACCRAGRPAGLAPEGC